MSAALPVSQFSLPPGFIDLGLGDPSFDLLPLDLIRQATALAFSREDPSILQYGTEQGSSW